MDADYIASVYEFSRRAHALPADVKRRFARPRGGYSGSDAGVEELAYEAGTTSAVRAWDYARENNSSHAAGRYGQLGLLVPQPVPRLLAAL